MRIITRNECRNEWVGKFIDVCPKQGLKPSEIKRMSDKEANEYEVFVTEDDSGWIDIGDVVEVMNARHHLVQPPKKSLEDNVFETSGDDEVYERRGDWKEGGRNWRRRFSGQRK